MRSARRPFAGWSRRLAVATMLAGTVWLAGSAVADGRSGEELELQVQLDTVQQLIDRDDPALAIEMLDSLAKGRGKRDKPTPREAMLRGTARIMLGEIKAGAAQLEEALARDPSLRQGWLNLGGLELAERNFEKALADFQKALALAPEKPDGHLNVGAVYVLLGRRVEAKTSFDRYLQLEGGSAEAHFLVAANYAMAKLEHLALEHLQKAIAANERLRLRAREDERFLGLDSLEYRVLLFTDDYQPPADHHRQGAAFRTVYDSRDGKLLYAVLDALKDQQITYDPTIESTARWGLIWAERGLRIKLFNQDNGTGVVSLSAPPSQFTPDEWQRTSQDLLRQVHRLLGE